MSGLRGDTEIMYPSDYSFWQRQLVYQHQMLALQSHYQNEIPGVAAAAGFWQAAVQAPVKVSPDLPGDVKVELDNRKLWKKFNNETTEMIITKSGRRMFPWVAISITGLDRKARYSVMLELVEASDRRHKYVGGTNSGDLKPAPGPKGWTLAGPAEPQPGLERRRYLHPDGPALGSHWMQQPVSFSKLKLTNNAMEHHSNMLLTSMHKYVPRIWIIRCDDNANAWDYYNNPASCFVFHETEFIAVTAYQNDNITKLKINNNPFAKGFRETGQSSCKRKRQGSEESGADSVASPSASPSSSFTCTTSSQEDPNSSANESCCSDSDQENSHPPAAKRVRVSDSPAPAEETPKPPKLHRPWADDDDKPAPKTTLAASAPVSPEEPLNLRVQSHAYSPYAPAYHHPLHHYLSRPAHYAQVDSYRRALSTVHHQHLPTLSYHTSDDE